MAVFELLAELGLLFGKDEFMSATFQDFMGYLHNTAALVRQTGVKKSGKLGEAFGNTWIVNDYIPFVQETYGKDKKGYNYRICQLNSLAAMMPYMQKDQITQMILPMFVKAMSDDIPNVRF